MKKFKRVYFLAECKKFKLIYNFSRCSWGSLVVIADTCKALDRDSILKGEDKFCLCLFVF